MDDNLFRTRFERQYRAEYDGADPAGFTALDFVGALGSVGNALLYSKLFWPEFIEVDGVVFLKDFVDDLGGPEGIRKRCNDLGCGQSIDKSINNFDVNLSFPNHPEENAEGDDLLLANQLAELWTLRLQQLYAHRRFHVEVNEDNGSPCVSFFEEV
ncbi:MAG TPA: hypothetical protein VGD64_04425 [Acidisarcina sp.]